VRCYFGQVLEVVWPRKLTRIETSGSADDVQRGVVLGHRLVPLAAPTILDS
jgi:hypothetical protein